MVAADYDSGAKSPFDNGQREFLEADALVPDDVRTEELLQETVTLSAMLGRVVRREMLLCTGKPWQELWGRAKG